jgi:uncharacterized membrane protein YgdD (TMEM256/DUF423 family)
LSGRSILATGALLVALATVLGALGAHALQGHLEPPRLAVYETAVRYHFYHALGLLGIGLASRQLNSRALRISATLILLGIVLFSGSLYGLSFGAPRWLGVVTPVGGVALIVGWLLFAFAIWRA